MNMTKFNQDLNITPKNDMNMTNKDSKQRNEMKNRESEIVQMHNEIKLKGMIQTSRFENSQTQFSDDKQDLQAPQVNLKLTIKKSQKNIFQDY